MSSIAELLASSGLAAPREDSIRELPDGTRALYLHAGQLHASREPMQITTILGSCVSICLWDPEAHVGGMNHYMLPDDVGASVATPRYANFAIRRLLDQLEVLGARRRRMLARLFGGASVMSTLPAARNLGLKNVDVGRARLLEAGIPIVQEDAGGAHGRKLVFFTATGNATLKRV